MTRDPVEQAKVGDRAAIDELLARSVGPLWAAADRRLGREVAGRIRASDLVQSALIDAVGSLPTFRGSTEVEFVGWVVRILENNLRDKNRFHRAQRRAIDREARLEDADSGGLGAVVQRSVSSDAIETEELARVGRAMQQLSEDHRRILNLRLFQGGTHEEVSERMERSVGACRVLYARARAALAVALGQGEVG